MADKALRTWHLLRSIPRHPKRRTPSELRESLIDAGFDLTLRSIQRDLIALSSAWGITCDVEGLTTHWYWPPDASLIDVPNMGSAEALVFLLAKENLHTMLPSSQLSVLKPYFDRAEALIGKEQIPVSRWHKRVRVIQPGLSLKTPDVSADVISEVHQALLRERQVRLLYKKRGEARSREYLLSPQALILRSGVIYLVATAKHYKDLLHFALHRAISAVLVDLSATKLNDFDLDRYIELEKAFAYPRGGKGTFRLRAMISPSLVEHLSERPLASDQQIKVDNSGSGALIATVPDTEDFRWWLLGLGSAIQVVGPVALRREVKLKLSEMLALYE